MPRPRILSSYNNKRQDVADGEKKGSEVRESELAKVKANAFGSDVIVIDDDADDRGETISRHTSSSYPTKKRIRYDIELESTVKLTRRAQQATKRAAMRIDKNSPERVSVSKDSSTAQCRTATDSSLRLGHPAASSSPAVVRMAPKETQTKSSGRVAGLVTDRRSCLTLPEANEPADEPLLVAAASSKVSQSVSIASWTRPTRGATGPSTVGQRLPRTTRRIPQLVQLQQSGGAMRSPKATTRSSARTFSDSTIRLPPRVINGLNDSNLVMTLPVVGKETNVFQNPTVCSLEKIENPSELARVQQVIGPRCEASRRSDQLDEAQRSGGSKERAIGESRSEENSDQPEEKSREFFAESEKALISDSRGSEDTNRLDRMRRRAVSSRIQAGLGLRRRKGVDFTSLGSGASSTNVSSESRRTRKNARLAGTGYQTRSGRSTTHARLTKALMAQAIHEPSRYTWRARCVVCKERFTDKCEFHRHATLSHPGIRIIFCESCSASFRTDQELDQHRVSYHKMTLSRTPNFGLGRIERSGTAKTTMRSRIVKLRNPIERSRIERLRSLVNRERPVKKKRADSMPSTVGRAGTARKRITASSVRTRNLRKVGRSESSAIGSGRTRLQARTSGQESSANAVNDDAKGEDANAANKKIESAELKRLVVPIERLETAVLQRYMPKHVQKPMIELASRMSRECSSSAETTPGTSGATSPSSVTNNANEKSAEKSLDREAGRLRKTRGTRNSARYERALTIASESKSADIPESPGRSVKRRDAKTNSSSDETSDANVSRIRSSNDENASRTRKSIREKIETDLPTSENITSIKTDETAKVADIDRERQIIRKLISRSSISSSVTLDINRRKNVSAMRSRLEDPDTESSLSTVRRSAVCTSSDESPSSPRKFFTSSSFAKHSSSSEDDPSRKFVPRKSAILSSLSSSSCEQFPRTESSTSLNSDEVSSDLPRGNAASSKNTQRSSANESEKEKSHPENRRKNEASKSDEEDGKGQNEEKLEEEKSAVESEGDHPREIITNERKWLEEESIHVNESRAGQVNEVGIKLNKKSKLDRADGSTDEDSKLEKKMDGVDISREKLNPDDTEQSVVSNKDENEIEIENEETRSSRIKSVPVASTSRKTYAFVKRSPKLESPSCESAKGEIGAYQDLCSVCEELFALMTKVSSEIAKRDAPGVPIKCPLCKRYFITLFHLRLHVVTNHLRCLNEIACGSIESSSTEEALRLIDLDRVDAYDETKVCPRCGMRFDLEGDRNDHVNVQHESILSRDTSRNVPEYLRDLRIGCFKSIIRENVKNSRSENAIPFDCSLCDEKFTRVPAYVRHLRETHGKLENTGYIGGENLLPKSSDDTDQRFFRWEEDSQPEVIIPDDSHDRMSADREYLLKQLLSDDSSGDEDGPRKVSRGLRRVREVGTRDSPDSRRNSLVEKSKEKAIIGPSSNCHTCNVCQKKFKRTHDLLIHGLYHGGKGAEKSRDIIDRTAESDREAQGREENYESSEQNASVVQRNEDSSRKIVTASERRSTASPTLKAPKIANKQADSKRPRITANPERSGKESRSREDRYSDGRDASMRELLETEVALVNKTSGKWPIACDKCNRHFANRTSLNEHLFFLHDDNLKDTVLTHVRTSDDARASAFATGSESDAERWRCEACVQSFKLFQGYSRHKYYVHGDDTMVHVCENCSKVLTSVTMVNVHICTDIASYNCRSCELSFPTGMSLRLHNTEKHTETRGPHVCGQCEKNFLTNAMLERHIECTHRFDTPHRSRRCSPVPTTTLDAEMETIPVELAEDRKVVPCSGKPAISQQSCESLVGARRAHWRSCRSKKSPRDRGLAIIHRPAQPPGKRKRGRPRKYPRSEGDSSGRSQDDDKPDPSRETISRDTTLYTDEREIHQCSLCQLFCISKSALRNHMSRIHSANDEICQLCQRPYTHGKLMRHVIDHHVTSEDGGVPELKRAWSFHNDSNEIDTEILVKMLGIDRLVSLCEYRRYAEKIGLDTYPCLSCESTFRNHELYRYHFLLQHDTACVLCNIEFKTGHDAARHKNDVHGSVGRYIWFADRTVLAMTSTRNFSDITDSILVQRLTETENPPEEHADGTIDDDEDKDDETETLDCTEILVYGKRGKEPNIVHDEPLGDETIIETPVSRSGCEIRENYRSTRLDKDRSSQNQDGYKDAPRSSEDDTMESKVCHASQYFAEPDDVCLVIVVTDEDLERFNIATRYPNIWGLAAEISSTHDRITPGEVKLMLERHFERKEDFDA